MASDPHGKRSGGGSGGAGSGDGDGDDSQGLKLGDAFKKVLTVGLGAAFMTEESIRSYLGEIKLPKELLQILLQSAQKSKDELMSRAGNEIVKVISKIDFVKEASRFMEEHKFRVQAEIEIVKKEPKV